MYGVPCITPSWIPVYEVSQRERINIEVSDYNEIVKTISLIMNEEWQEPVDYQREKTEIVEGTYGNLEGDNHQRVSEFILERIETQPLNMTPKLFEWFLPTDSVRQRLRKRIIQTVNLPLNLTFERLRRYNQPIAWDSSEKRFSVPDVQKIVDAVVTHVADFHDIRYNIQQGVFPDYRYLNGRTIVLERID